MLKCEQQTTFKVTVEESDDVKCVQCNRCTKPVYFSKGWHCMSCAPSKRTCKNNIEFGCTYKDVPMKCQKHELYYCPFNSRCEICMKNISDEGLMEEHYAQKHSSIIRNAGFSWENTITDDWQWCIINSDIGNLVCVFKSSVSDFQVYIRTPLPSEMMYRYKCIVAISNPATAHVVIQTAHVDYTQVRDWIVQFKDGDVRHVVENDKYKLKIALIRTGNLS